MTNYTPSAAAALKLAARISKQQKQNYIGTEHLLLGLIRENTGVAAKMLQAHGLTDERVTDLISQLNVESGPVALMDRLSSWRGKTSRSKFWNPWASIRPRCTLRCWRRSA